MEGGEGEGGGGGGGGGVFLIGWNEPMASIELGWRIRKTINSTRVGRAGEEPCLR